VLAPRGTGEGFDKIEGFLCFKGRGADVGPKDKFGVQGEPEDDGVSDSGNCSVVDFEFEFVVILSWVGGEEGGSGFIRVQNEVVNVEPVS